MSIYLDYNATTPLAPEVLEAVARSLAGDWGNPSSGHPAGRAARCGVDRARTQVASLIGAHPDEVVFTSGGTESDNAALFGVAESRAAAGRHLIVTAIEHPAVLEAASRLEARGWSVTRVPAGASGAVEPDAVVAAFRPETVLVSIMHANNETGVLQPVASVARRAREHGILVHTDAAQSAGKLPVSVEALGVDLLTIAGHKLYGPKGVGALYLRRGTPFAPYLVGAGHEGGRRAGTENVPGIVGLGAACALAEAETERRGAHLRRLRDRLQASMERAISGLVVHGRTSDRLPNTLSASIPGVEGHVLLSGLAEHLAASAGAACHGSARFVSHVLRSMGVPEEVALGTVRLSVGRETTDDDVDRAAGIIAAAARARAGSPG